MAPSLLCALLSSCRGASERRYPRVSLCLSNRKESCQALSNLYKSPSPQSWPAHSASSGGGIFLISDLGASKSLLSLYPYLGYLSFVACPILVSLEICLSPR